MLAVLRNSKSLIKRDKTLIELLAEARLRMRELPTL